jgi:membrane-associated phospholipid phosphatase
MSRTSFLLSFVAVSVFCILSYFFLDRPLALWIDRNVNVTWSSFFFVVTRLGKAENWFGLAGLFLLIGYGLKWRVRSLKRSGRPTDRLSLLEEKAAKFYKAGIFMIVALIAAGIVVNVLKFVSGRYRPQLLFTDSVLYGFKPLSMKLSLNSFPSGHAQAIFTAMTGLFLLYPRHVLTYGLVALLVFLSRPFLGVHYLSDVVMGAYVGIVLTVWIHHLFLRRGYLQKGG